MFIFYLDNIKLTQWVDKVVNRTLIRVKANALTYLSRLGKSENELGRGLPVVRGVEGFSLVFWGVCHSTESLQIHS